MPRNAWLQAFACVGISLVAIGIFSWLTGLAGQVCAANEKGGEPDCHSYNLAYAILLQGFVWLNDPSVLITAVATALLTYVTVLLFRIEREGGDTTRAQLRAYVGIVDSSIANFVERQTPIVHIALRNNGQTPAYDFYASLSVGIGPYPLPAKNIPMPNPLVNLIDGKVKVAQIGVGIVTSSHTTHVSQALGIIVSPEAMVEIKAGKRARYAWGLCQVSRRLQSLLAS